MAGWALAPTDLANVVVELDGVQVTTVPVDASRPDVCGVYPGYAGCPLVGHDRQGLERLCRYGARGPVAESRLQALDDGSYASSPNVARRAC